MADAARFAAAVAKGAHLGVYRDALAALDRAEAAGTRYEDAAPAIASALTADWTGAGPALALTLDNAASQAVDLGRVEALQADTAARPWWYFSAVGDDQTSAICEACDGTLLPASHPWWARHIPSLHLRCRSAIVAATAAQAEAMGGATAAPDVEADEGFGTLADLCAWEPLPGAYPVELHEPFFPPADGRRPMADRFAPQQGPSMFLSASSLPSSIRAEVAAALTALTLNTIALHLAAQVAHWNVKGPAFGPLHALFSDVRGAFDDYEDDLAERAVAYGAVAEGTIEQAAAGTRLPPYPPQAAAGLDHVRLLFDRVAAWTALARAARETCDRCGDPETSNMLSSMIEGAEKWGWKLAAHLES